VKKITKMILPVLLTFAMLTASSFPSFAAPIDKIMSDAVFLAAFDPAHAVTLPYTDGEKAAVEIPSNAHYSDYANEGFWFFWDSKQTDSGYAVLSDKFFITNESLTITVKSTNVYKNVTITRPGTYFINRFLLKNEKKGPEGGYQNINWVGFSKVEKAPLYLDMNLSYSLLYGGYFQPGSCAEGQGCLSNIGTSSACAEITPVKWAQDSSGNPLPTDALITSYTIAIPETADNGFLVYDQASADAYLNYRESAPEPYRGRLAPPVMLGKIPVIPGVNNDERVFFFYPGAGDYYTYTGDTSSGGYALKHYDSFKVDLDLQLLFDGSKMGSGWQGARVAVSYDLKYSSAASFEDIEDIHAIDQYGFDNMIFGEDSPSSPPIHTIQEFLSDFYFK